MKNSSLEQNSTDQAEWWMVRDAQMWLKKDFIFYLIQMTEAEIINEINIIWKMCRIAANVLWKEILDIEVEAVYTKNLLRLLERWDSKVSVDMIIKQIFSEMQKYGNMGHYTDFSWENDVAQSPEESCNPLILKKCYTLKKLIWDQWYERFCSYYNSIKKYRNPNGIRDKSRSSETVRIHNKKKRILKQISQSPELQEIFG